MPTNPSNKKRKSGIENLLSENSISDEFYQIKEIEKDSGDSTTTRTLRKADFCAHMCKNGTKEQFEAFAEALDIIERYLELIQPKEN